MKESPERILKKLEKILKDKNGAYVKLKSFALKCMLEHLSEKVLRKYNPEDFISDGVLKLVNGSRCWDSEKYPDFYKFLFLLVKSEIRNLAKKYDPTDNFYFEKMEREDRLSSIKNEDELLNKHDIRMHPEIEDKPEGENKFNILDECYDVLGGDIEGKKVFALMYEGMKPREIVEALNLGIKKVRAAVKRVHRKIDPLAEVYFEKKGMANRFVKKNRA